MLQVYTPNKFNHNKNLLFEQTMKKTVKIRQWRSLNLLKQIQYSVITVNTVLILSSWTMIDWIALSSIPFLLFLQFFSTHQSPGDLFYSHNATRLNFEKPQPPNIQMIWDYPGSFKGAWASYCYLATMANTESFTSDQLWSWLCQALNFLAKTNIRYDRTMVPDIHFNRRGRSKF